MKSCLAPSRIHMRLQTHWLQRNGHRSASMSVGLSDLKDAAASDLGNPRTFWKKVTQLLDQLVVNRSARAIPAVVLRRSKLDYDRCLRLMRQGSIASTASSPNKSSSQLLIPSAYNHEPTTTPSSSHKCSPAQRCTVSNGLRRHGSRGMAKTDR